MRTDVCIVVGGIMGCSVAYYCKMLDPAVDIVVVEPDPTYEFSSTLRASGGARHLFSCPENIEMSKYSIRFIKSFAAEMAVDGEPARSDWHEGGYLFLVPPESVGVLQANARIQERLGVEIELLDPPALRHRYPSMNVADIGAAVLSPRDGWCDPHGLLQGFRRKARALGVRFVQDRVADFDLADGIVRAARLAGGETLAADAFVIAAGAWSADVAAKIGMPLPIAPLPRSEYYFTIQRTLEPLPFVKDLARLAFRPEGKGYAGTLVNSDEPRGFRFETEPDYFERVVWPALAHRFSAFEATRCERFWTGLYEQCELDGNPIIGNWPGRHDNVYVIAGFSGHGLMHAPAAGRAIAELIRFGAFRTVDLARLGYRRVLENRPYPETGIL